MEEKFLNKIQKIIEELNKLDKMPNVVEWNDKRAASQNFNKKEKIYENSKEGEILQILDETTDIEERKDEEMAIQTLPKTGRSKDYTMFAWLFSGLILLAMVILKRKVK